METHALSLLLIALATPLLLPPGPGLRQPVAGAEYSTKTDPDYEFGDYRGKWCIDDHGFVYNIGEVYFPSPTACPCTCTVDGPVCVRPRCPRIHPRCTRIRFKACCPVCEAMARVCVYGGKTYRPLEEFRLSRCERCRCEANREVYCSISDCPAPHCVNPTYQPNHCCPICKTGEVSLDSSSPDFVPSVFTYTKQSPNPHAKMDRYQRKRRRDETSCMPSDQLDASENTDQQPSLAHHAGPNCFAGNQVIPAGERVNIDEQTVCYCTFRDGTWHTHPQATCEKLLQPSPTSIIHTESPRGREGRPLPRLDLIP